MIASDRSPIFPPLTLFASYWIAFRCKMSDFACSYSCSRSLSSRSASRTRQRYALTCLISTIRLPLFTHSESHLCKGVVPMLKIVYPVCCGMDVHKSFVVACVDSTNDHGVTTYRSGRFSTFTGDLCRLAAWLHAHSCTDVCMDSSSTGFPVCRSYRRSVPFIGISIQY